MLDVSLLEDDLSGKLHIEGLSRSNSQCATAVASAAAAPEGRRSYQSSGVRKISAVEDVEHLCAQLQADLLADLSVLHHRNAELYYCQSYDGTNCRCPFNRFPNDTQDISKGFDQATLRFLNYYVSALSKKVFPRITSDSSLVNEGTSNPGPVVFSRVTSSLDWRRHSESIARRLAITIVPSAGPLQASATISEPSISMHFQERPPRIFWKGTRP